MSTPTRKLSNRAQVAKAFTDALRAVSNGRYRVYRGPVVWALHDFEAHPAAATVVLDNVPLADTGDMTVVVEILMAWREVPVDDDRTGQKLGPLDDLTLDDAHEDLRIAIREAGKKTRQDGEAVIIGIYTPKGVVQSAIIPGVAMGIVATIPLGF